MDARHPLVLALVAAPLPLVAEETVARAYGRWLLHPYTIQSWLLLFLAIALYYYLLSPLSLTIIVAHNKRLAGKALLATTYVYLVFFLTGLAAFTTGLRARKPPGQGGAYTELVGIAPYLSIVLGALLSTLAGIIVVNYARQNSITQSLSEATKSALGAIAVAWATWIASLIALSITGLDKLIIYDPGIRLHYSYAEHSYFAQETMASPLARVTMGSVLARYISLAVLSWLLRPVKIQHLYRDNKTPRRGGECRFIDPHDKY